MIKQILEDAKRQGSLLEIHSNPDRTTSFSCCTVLEVTNDFVLAKELDRTREPGPWVLHWLTDIWRVSRNSLYLFRLAGGNETELSELLISERSPIRADLREAISDLISSSMVATIHNDSDDSTPCRLLSLDDEGILYEAYDEKGRVLGEEAMRLDDLRKIEVGGVAEGAVKKLIPERRWNPNSN